MSERAHLGDVVVRDGEPPEGNPWRAPESNDRERALEDALAGRDISPWTFWHVPYRGPCRRLESPRDEIDWTAMRGWQNYPYRADGSLRRNPADI